MAAKVYTRPELEFLWISAGGDPSVAGDAASIALAESGGKSDARNNIGATGLWQIFNGPNTDPGLTDPVKNAKAAVAKFNAAGGKRAAHASWASPGQIAGFSPWTTYTGLDTGPGGTPGKKTYLDWIGKGTGATSISGGAIPGAVGAVTGAVSDTATSLARLVSFLINPKNWLRLVEVLTGGVLMVVGLRVLVSHLGSN